MDALKQIIMACVIGIGLMVMIQSASVASTSEGSDLATTTGVIEEQSGSMLLIRTTSGLQEVDVFSGVAIYPEYAAGDDVTLEYDGVGRIIKISQGNQVALNSNQPLSVGAILLASLPLLLLGVIGMSVFILLSVFLWKRSRTTLTATPSTQLR